MSPPAKEVLCPSCGGTAEVIAVDASGTRTAVCSFCYGTVTVDAAGRAVPTTKKADKAQRSDTASEKPKKAKKAEKPKKVEKPKPPDPATLVRAVLTRAGIASASSSKVVPDVNLQPLSQEQAKLVERIGEHVAYFRRADEGDMAEAFSGLTEAVALGGELNQHMRSDALELIEELGRQASSPENDRSAKAVLRSVLAGLGSTCVVAPSVAGAWRSSSRRVEEFFGVE